MLQTEYIIDPPAILRMEISPQDTLFFDIETTGLSTEHSHLYLIGCCCVQDQQWTIRQWFAEKSSEEFSILEHFLAFANRFSLLVSYNGSTFDLPYLKKKCKAYLLSGEPLSKSMLDIFRSINPCRKLFSLSHLRQTDAERWLGLYREDCYSGKELIGVYRQYQKTKRDDLLSALLLHNKEDVEGMLTCMNMLTYSNAFEGHFTFAKGSYTQTQCTLEFQLSLPVPKPVHCAYPQAVLDMEEDKLILTLPVREQSIRCYLPDYEHYMYLTEDHTLIPKKLAKLTGSSLAVPADLITCYQQIALTDELVSSEKNAMELAKNYLKWLLRYMKTAESIGYCEKR